MLSQNIPPWPDLDITPAFSLLWSWFHKVFEWAQSSYFVFYGHRVSYAELVIFGMVFGMVLMLSPFGKVLNLYNPDLLDDEDLESEAGSGWFDNFEP